MGYSPWGCKELGMTELEHRSSIREIISILKNSSYPTLCSPFLEPIPSGSTHYILFYSLMVHVGEIPPAPEGHGLSPPLQCFPGQMRL